MVTQKKRRRDGDARAGGTRDERQYLGKTNQQRITSETNLFVEWR